MRERNGWLLVLLAAVLVPTAALLWFVNQAASTQTTMAVQSAHEAYRGHLRVIRSRLTDEWVMRTGELDALPNETPQARYERIMASGLVDAVIVLDENGRVFTPKEVKGSAATGAVAAMVGQFLDNNMVHTDRGGLLPTHSGELWQLASNDGFALALYRYETVHTLLHRIVEEHQSPLAQFIVFKPDEMAFQEALPVGPAMAGWQVSFQLLDRAAIERGARARAMSYLWIGLVGVVVIALVGAGAGHALQRQLKLSRLKTDLVAAVSHELRTPLASTRLLVDGLLQSEQFDPVRTREYLEMISRENARLTRMIENFLTFSRLERNRLPLSFVEVAPQAIVDAVREATRERLPAVETIDIDVEPDLPLIRADADAMVTAMLNLLDNAYKYTPAEKQIRIRVARDGTDVLFMVEDNGIGIPVAEQKRIFRRFYRTDRRLSRETSGVGLGLSIVQDIAIAHGGDVRVASRSGEGSTFTMRLPAAEPAA
jgi:signal transduction histidine kinase